MKLGEDSACLSKKLTPSDNVSPSPNHLPQNTSSSEDVAPQEFSLVRLIGINLPALNYGLYCASLGVLVLPQEAQRMFAEQRSLYLAIMLVLAGVSQLVCPMVGYASDRTRSRLGRRMPYILLGDVGALLSLGMLYLARTELWGNAYLVGVLLGTLSLNIAYTGFTGLVSDIVPPSQLSFASGLMGGLTAVGAVGGLLGVGFFLPLSSAYALYGGVVLLSMPLVWLAAHEHDVELSVENCQPWALSDLRSSYWISPGTHGDFFWVFVSRTFYYMAVSIQIYILYYLRDMIGQYESWVREDAVMYTTVLCVVAQGSAGLVAAIAGGRLSELVGRKPLIYMACAVMASVYVGYIFAKSYYAVLALGLIYGAGNGVYLAVDYALAVECLPNPDDTAKDLALWGIAAFIGTCLGPAFTGPLLTVIGAEEQGQPGSGDDNVEPGENVHYRAEGYVAVMLMGVLYSFACGLFVTRVQKGNTNANAAAATTNEVIGVSECEALQHSGSGKHVPLDSEDPYDDDHSHIA